MNPDELAEFLAGEMKAYVAAAEQRILTALEERLVERIEEAISRTLPELKGEKGEPGTAGEKGDPGTVDHATLAAAIAEEVARQVGALDREALRGPPGADGKDIELEVIRSLVSQEVGRINPESIRGPRGKKGEKGDKGEDGERGDPGRDGVGTRDELHVLIAEGIDKVLPAAVEDHVAVEFKKLPVLIYRGVFLEGEEYLPGNTATWAGSLWHCNTRTREKPPGPNGEWTLAVKRGRDGKGA